MICKKIHYCWFGGKKLPREVLKCINSWKKYCPDYEIIRWDESNFDINCCNFVRQAYENKAWAFVSDFARLKIIYENGGIYLDTDVELLKSLDDLLNLDCYFATQQEGEYIATGLGFGSEKGAKILQEMIEVYENLDFDNSKKEELACPLLNTKVIKKYNYQVHNEPYIIKDINVTIFPPKYFDPIAPGNYKNLLSDKTFSIHHYSATWMAKKVAFKRKIINIIGQERINQFKKKLRRK